MDPQVKLFFRVEPCCVLFCQFSMHFEGKDLFFDIAGKPKPDMRFSGFCTKFIFILSVMVRGLLPFGLAFSLILFFLQQEIYNITHSGMEVDTPKLPIAAQDRRFASLVEEVKSQQWIALNKQKAYLTKQEELSKVQNRIGTVQILQEVECKKHLIPDANLLHEQNTLMDEQRHLAAEQSHCLSNLHEINMEIQCLQKKLLSLLDKIPGWVHLLHECWSVTLCHRGMCGCDNHLTTTASSPGDLVGDDILCSPPLESALHVLSSCKRTLANGSSQLNNHNYGTDNNTINSNNNIIGDDITVLSDFINSQAPHMTKETLRDALAEKEQQIRRQAGLYNQLADKVFYTRTLLMWVSTSLMNCIVTAQKSLSITFLTFACQPLHFMLPKSSNWATRSEDTRNKHSVCDGVMVSCPSEEWTEKYVGWCRYPDLSTFYLQPTLSDCNTIFRRYGWETRNRAVHCRYSKWKKNIHNVGRARDTVHCQVWSLWFVVSFSMFPLLSSSLQTTISTQEKFTIASLLAELSNSRSKSKKRHGFWKSTQTGGFQQL